MTQRGLYPRSVHDALGFMAALDPASPDTMARRTIPRHAIPTAAGAATPTTGKLLVAEMWLEGGDTVTGVAFITGTTAAVAPTSGFVAIYRADGTLIGQSADTTNTARAASTVYTVNLATPYTVQRTAGKHFVAWCLAAGTMPTLLGSPIAPPTAAGEGYPARESTSATYTTTAPATLPAMTNRIDLPYLVCV